MKKIMRVFKVPDFLLKDCFYIVNQTRPDEAENLYHRLQIDVENRRHIMFCCNEDNFQFGFIKGSIDKNYRRGKIDYLFVDKKYQRNGVGGALLEAYEKHCVVNNVLEIFLYAVPTSQALNFYNKNGYVVNNDNYLMVKYFGR